MELNHNGVTLSFDYEGAGKYAYLLIHGVGANRLFFSSTFNHLIKSGRVLNADLRGHGKSDKPDQPYLIETYADDLGWLVQELKLDNIIVIGHSMGGNIAMEFVARHPELVKGVVLLDAWLFWSESSLAFFADRLKEMKSPEFTEHLHKLVEMRCFPTDRHKDMVLNSFLSTSQYVWCSSLENMQNWDTNRAAASAEACHVPVLYIQTDKLLIDLEKFHHFSNSPLILGKVIGSGHFCNLEVPEQVNAMIDRFMSTYVGTET